MKNTWKKEYVAGWKKRTDEMRFYTVGTGECVFFSMIYVRRGKIAEKLIPTHVRGKRPDDE